jgi:hypothetical protein
MYKTVSYGRVLCNGMSITLNSKDGKIPTEIGINSLNFLQ